MYNMQRTFIIELRKTNNPMGGEGNVQKTWTANLQKEM